MEVASKKVDDQVAGQGEEQHDDAQDDGAFVPGVDGVDPAPDDQAAAMPIAPVGG
jgi:hypothetical protein